MNAPTVTAKRTAASLSAPSGRQLLLRPQGHTLLPVTALGARRALTTNQNESSTASVIVDDAELGTRGWTAAERRQHPTPAPDPRIEREVEEQLAEDHQRHRSSDRDAATPPPPSNAATTSSSSWANATRLMANRVMNMTSNTTTTADTFWTPQTLMMSTHRRYLQTRSTGRTTTSHHDSSSSIPGQFRQTAESAGEAAREVGRDLEAAYEGTKQEIQNDVIGQIKQGFKQWTSSFAGASSSTVDKAASSSSSYFDALPQVIKDTVVEKLKESAKQWTTGVSSASAGKAASSSSSYFDALPQAIKDAVVDKLKESAKQLTTTASVGKIAQEIVRGLSASSFSSSSGATGSSSSFDGIQQGIKKAVMGKVTEGAKQWATAASVGKAAREMGRGLDSAYEDALREAKNGVVGKVKEGAEHWTADWKTKLGQLNEQLAEAYAAAKDNVTEIDGKNAMEALDAEAAHLKEIGRRIGVYSKPGQVSPQTNDTYDVAKDNVVDPAPTADK
ncbi:hypothetical protein H4R33_004501 [Dimargaris cristalligena]|nr:hypothetical protein H4R33_004501 [Dimargaris cristalligena]